MPTLEATLVAGQDRILETNISNCEVNNVGEDVLKDQGWAELVSCAHTLPFHNPRPYIYCIYIYSIYI